MNLDVWEIHLVPESRSDLESWMEDEDNLDYDLRMRPGRLVVQLYDMDLALRCRLYFDDDLIY